MGESRDYIHFGCVAIARVRCDRSESDLGIVQVGMLIFSSDHDLRLLSSNDVAVITVELI